VAIHSSSHRAQPGQAVSDSRVTSGEGALDQQGITDPRREPRGRPFLDAPPIEIGVTEEPSSFGPYGAKGVGEPPTVSSTAAVVAAIREATGLELSRTPVRPEHVAHPFSLTKAAGELVER